VRVRKWGIAALTLAWLAWELWAAFDTSQDTWPLTQIVVTYVPAWLYLPGALVLAVWLPWHFWTNWKRQPGRTNIMTLPDLQSAARNARLVAFKRAVATFLQGLVADVLLAVSGALSLLLADVHPTKAWAVAAGVTLGKTALTAAVTYVHRRLRPPVA
jgi:hypothetical protein